MSSKLIKEVEAASTIGISGHIRPDGDCVGSTTGLYHYIRDNYPEKDVKIFLQPFSQGIMDVIDMPVFTPCEDLGDHPFDLFVSLDSSSSDRLGDAESIFKNAKKTVVLDHHKTNTGFGDINIVVPDSCSACEVLFDCLEEEKISLSCAKSIYLGIVHDSGVFKYSAVTGHTMEIAGKLIDKGIDTSYLIDRSFYSKTWNQTKLFARALDKACITEDGMITYTLITREDLAEFDCTCMDTDGIVEQLRLVDTAEIAMFVREDGDSFYKFSLRGKTGIIDVSEIACAHGGGGHYMAAGFNLEGDADAVVSQVLSEIKEKLAAGRRN